MSHRPMRSVFSTFLYVFSARDLGVVIDSGLTMSDHVTADNLLVRLWQQDIMLDFDWIVQKLLQHHITVTYSIAADTRPTNVGQHVNKSLSCVQKVGKHFTLANNVGPLRTCSFFVGQQAANRTLWLVGKHHGGRMDGCILCWLH